MERGELSVTQTGVLLKLRLCVTNWDSLQMVRPRVILHTNSTSSIKLELKIPKSLC